MTAQYSSYVNIFSYMLSGVGIVKEISSREPSCPGHKGFVSFLNNLSFLVS